MPITAMEFDLLEAFANHPNRVLTREQLLDFSHRRGNDPFDRSIDVRVNRLRQKMSRNPIGRGRSRPRTAPATSSSPPARCSTRPVEACPSCLWQRQADKDLWL